MAGLPSASQSSLDFLRGLLNPSPAPSLELPPSGVYPEDVVKLPGVNGGSDTYGLVIVSCSRLFMSDSPPLWLPQRLLQEEQRAHFKLWR